MDEREAMTMSSTSQYYIQYRGIGRSDSGSPAGLHEPPPAIRSMPTPTASPPSIIRSMPNPTVSPPAQSSRVEGGSVSSTLPPQGGNVVGQAGIALLEPVKKKRGRPRKYGPDGTMALVLSPQASSPQAQGSGAGAGEGAGSAGPVQKRGRGRPPGTGTKQQLASLGGWIADSAGMGFTPHIITIAIGEDIAAKIMSFSQQGPRAVCILSATGSVSTVTLRQPSTSGGTVTYEGRFEILCMSGSYMLTDEGGSRNRTGGLSISLSSPDGRVIGGGVGGLLVAASPVQVIVGSFIYGGSKARNKTGGAPESGETEPAADAEQNTPTSEVPTQTIPLPPVIGWPDSSEIEMRNQVEMRNSHGDIDLMRE